MDNIHTVTSGDILSWYEQARQQEDSLNLFYNAVEKSSLFSVEDFAVPASCRNKELAWEFIKYCISARDSGQIDFNHLGWPTSYSNNIPISRANCRSLVEDMRDNGPSGFLLGYPEFDPEMDVDVLMEKLDEVLSLPLVDKKKYGVDVKDYLGEFYVNELSTAEECAEKIQGRTEIWLNE